MAENESKRNVKRIENRKAKDSKRELVLCNIAREKINRPRAPKTGYPIPKPNPDHHLTTNTTNLWTEYNHECFANPVNAELERTRLTTKWRKLTMKRKILLCYK